MPTVIPPAGRLVVRGLRCSVGGMLLVILASGCSSLGRPDWLEPGPEANQRRRAVRFDPYLQNDIGPYQFRMPLMDGTRPRDYAEPVSEVKRSRWWSGGR